MIVYDTHDKDNLDNVRSVERQDDNARTGPRFSATELQLGARK